MKAERTIKDERARLRALFRNPAVQDEERHRAFAALCALEWVLEIGPPPVYAVVQGGEALAK